jgi:hypothetical protein
MDDYLPIGGHLLPADYQDFIRRWNMTIANYSGLTGYEGWGGEKRKAFRLAFPKAWKMWCKLSRHFSEKYADHVAALKKYQLEYEQQEQDSDEDSEQEQEQEQESDEDRDEDSELRELQRLEEHERQEAAEMDYLISLQ